MNERPIRLRYVRKTVRLDWMKERDHLSGRWLDGMGLSNRPSTFAAEPRGVIANKGDDGLSVRIEMMQIRLAVPQAKTSGMNRLAGAKHAETSSQLSVGLIDLRRLPYLAQILPYQEIPLLPTKSPY